MQALSVGLVGAGPWASETHAPMLAAGPETRLAAVWARRPEAARELAREHGCAVAGSYQELLDLCDAVAFAVPPAVQCELAITAARAGKALLLDKPIAGDLESAAALTEAVDAAGVVSQVVLSFRYQQVTRDFLAQAQTFPALGARSLFVHGLLRPGQQAAVGWRLVDGVLLDLGPHVFDLLDAALGPIESVTAAGDPHRWVEVTCRHQSGLVSQASFSGSVGVRGGVTRLELYGGSGVLTFDAADLDAKDRWSLLRAEFAQAVRKGTSGPLDVHRGLMLQRVIEQATRSL
ncbi:Gfo/Idh/MocA family oxidoreductase [Fodinicola feengrottensis]|uniref:Gfo/Idh/MocA family oxidoreductase n=1 Tax=Fodinicola feengrottensis TaxID=435914 RepID=A0ABN2GGW3_9ACTN